MSTRYEDEFDDDFEGGARGPRAERGDRPLWGPFAVSAQQHIMQKIDPNYATFPDEKAWWTPDHIVKVTHTIIELYSNLNTQVQRFANIRAGLAWLNVPDEDIAVMNPITGPITEERNYSNNKKISDRIMRGLDVPEEFHTVEGVARRVADYLRERPAEPSGQMVADLHIVFAARPGERQTLTIGPSGGVKGVLKKKNAEEEFELLTVIGEAKARAFLALWKSYSTPKKSVAVKAFANLCQEWGVQQRDMRAIGAHLMVRAATLNGNIGNAGQQRQTTQKALRHGDAPRQPVDHYERVNDTEVRMAAAQISELPETVQKNILAMIQREYAKTHS